jgi:hypothetical protein
MSYASPPNAGRANVRNFVMTLQSAFVFWKG